MKKRLRTWLMDILAILFGTGIMALGLVLFTVPNQIAPGGISGLATALASLTPITVGMWSLLLNVPIVVVAWWKLGLRSISQSILGAVLLSLFIDLFTPLVAPYTNNPLLAAVVGGVLLGAGTGLVFIRGASTGGTDLISILLARVFPNVSLGMLLLCADAAVVVIAVVIFQNIEVALYSIVTIYVSSKTIDAIMQGVDHAKVIHVITEQAEAIRELLSKEKELGVTLLPGSGGYSMREKTVFLLVVRRNELSQTIKAIQKLDRKAFLFVTDATEVHGEGFKEP